MLSISGLPSETKEDDIKQLIAAGDCGSTDVKVLKCNDGNAVAAIKQLEGKGTIELFDNSTLLSKVVVSMLPGLPKPVLSLIELKPRFYRKHLATQINY